MLSSIRKRADVFFRSVKIRDDTEAACMPCTGRNWRIISEADVS